MITALAVLPSLFLPGREPAPTSEPDASPSREGESALNAG